MRIDTPAEDRIDITWTSGQDRAALRVDLSDRTAWITASSPAGDETFPVHAITRRTVAASTAD